MRPDHGTDAESDDPNDGGTALPQPAKTPCAAVRGGELPIDRALFRVMRALMFDDKPLPEMDALPLAQLRLLWTVYHGSDGTMKDFSERLSVSQSTVTQIADRLVRRGLVERLADPTDRRVVRLQLSAIGKQLLGQADVQRKRTLNEVWDALSVQEQSAVMHGLETLGRTAENVRAAQGRPLPSWPDPFAPTEETPALPAGPAASQPVVDLMTRRIRGRKP